MPFSKEEFNIMVDELLYQETVSFDMLASITYRVLREKVVFFCNRDSRLKGRCMEEDLLQEISIKVINKTIPFFLLKDGPGGPVNYNPDGFRKWIITLADNYIKDYAEKFGKMNFIEGNKFIDVPKKDDSDDTDAKREELKRAFGIVMSANVRVYKILTWLAQFLVIINYDVTKIQSNEKMIELFEQKTLFEMYDMLLDMSEYVDWIEITDSHHEKIMESLNKPWNKHFVYGEIKYGKFFMNARVAEPGKKSISDWVNRMNKMLDRKMGKNKSESNSEEGHSDDESSDS